jgi:hypothetical protein
VVFGGPAGTVSRAPRHVGLDEAVLSVHGQAGKQLGYAVLRLGRSGKLWGGLTLSSELALPDVRVLAWRTELQLASVGLDRGGHHCLLSVSRCAAPDYQAPLVAEFDEALRPLYRDGTCEIVFTERRTLEPPMVADAFRACAVAATLAAMENAGLEPRRATVALHRPQQAGTEVMDALTSEGLTPVRPEYPAVSTPVDVLLLDGTPQTLSVAEAYAVRARVLIALGAVMPSAAAMSRLEDRHIVLVSDTWTGAGRFLALDAIRRGLDPDVAIGQAAATIREEVRRRSGAGRSAQ